MVVANNIRGRNAGMVGLTNPANDGPEYVSIAVGATRAPIRSNGEIVRRFMRAYAEAVHLFKTNKAIALPSRFFIIRLIRRPLARCDNRKDRHTSPPAEWVGLYSQVRLVTLSRSELPAD